MGKRKTHSKRSLGSLPKGLPVRGGGSGLKDAVNPFDVTHRSKRPKFEVHNRGTSMSKQQQKPSALAEALRKRQSSLRESIQQSRKANVFADRRIGEYDYQMTADEQKLARLVRERARRSNKISKFSLEEDDNDVLTHRGKSLADVDTADDILLSDDDNADGGNLDSADTLLHFGGGNLNKDRLAKKSELSSYGPGEVLTTLNLATQYGDLSRKMELEDLIMKRKLIKAEKMKSKEEQVTTFEKFDEKFSELAGMLSFRDKYSKEKKGDGVDKDIKEIDEMDEWDKQMKQFLYGNQPKVKASDRTKTPEEIAKEEYDRLHKLETRRLARMNGTATEDDLDDILPSDSDDDGTTTKRINNKHDHPEALDNESDNDDDNEDDGITTRFTADGLIQIDKDGNVLGKFGEVVLKKNKQRTETNAELKVGTRIKACYHAKEQYVGDDEEQNDELKAWYNGVIAQVNDDGTYNVDYDDGDYEDNIEQQYIQAIDETHNDIDADTSKHATEVALKKKRQKARELARSEIPYVFEVPTTLDGFHDIISQYATTGDDVTLIIQRIHKANSVRLDKRNTEKMQNFYDVLIRRFIAVGDAIYKSGDGGVELSRYKQLDSLTTIMYEMSQESPNCAASVWSRRIGYFHKAHMKRLRDSELDTDENENDDEPFTAWPSTGVILLLRAVGHIFPVTDKKHPIVTPVILFLGQILCTTPIVSKHDLVLGLMCCGILIEFTKEAKRIVPEANAFLESTIRLFASNRYDPFNYSLPTIGAASDDSNILSLIRSEASKYEARNDGTSLRLSIEKDGIYSKSYDSSAAILFSALQLTQSLVQNLADSLSCATGREAFSSIAEAILSLDPKSKLNPLPKQLQTSIASVVLVLTDVCKFEMQRTPLQRRNGDSRRGVPIKTLAPRIENPERYSFSKDKGKSATQSAADRTRREYKREHKAVARELRLDGAFVETERRQEQQAKADAARAKRHRAFAWMEGEQATMNQQVRQGGGLLQGGGTGAAKLKARSGKLGIKKGGKF